METELSSELRDKLIGFSAQEYGFTALMKSDDAVYLPNGFVVERPSIDQIMIHLIKGQQ